MNPIDSSKLRKSFEKNPDTVCIPFYSDNYQTLSKIINSFFYKAKMQMSQENINLLINRCSGDRQNLNNELKKKQILKSKYVKFTNNIEDLNESNIHIIAVPTPVNKKNIPDLKK